MKSDLPSVQGHILNPHFPQGRSSTKRDLKIQRPLGFGDRGTGRQGTGGQPRPAPSSDQRSPAASPARLFPWLGLCSETSSSSYRSLWKSGQNNEASQWEEGCGCRGSDSLCLRKHKHAPVEKIRSSAIRIARCCGRDSAVPCRNLHTLSLLSAPKPFPEIQAPRSARASARISQHYCECPPGF